MIKKLRIKFIIVSMASLFIVLFLIMSTISFLNYREVVTNADSTLSILAKNDGEFPDMGPNAKEPLSPDGHPQKGNPLSPELPFESRYFSVLLNEKGDAIHTNTGKIAAVDTATAIACANTVWKKGHTHGFLDNYRYISYVSGSDTHIIFLDCGRNLDTLRTFIFTGISVSTIGLLAVFFLIFLLSGHIIKPFSENYEKQKRFITDAGHELKTPLTIINADTEVLSMDFGENEWINDIQSQTKRLTDLTNDLILLSRMEEEQSPTQMIEFPLSDVIEETTNSFQVLAKTQGKTIDTQIEPFISMYGDEKALRHLLTLFLDNAIKYSDQNGKISVTLKKQKSQIKLSIYNSTESISRQQLDHLFDRFYRTDQSRNSQTGGYGLGLSIAAAIVSAHKGKISASTEDEKSLLIKVVFPTK
ncbi:two-component system sensor histidine kinase CiaH [Aequitasia blattaphilus]|uniref:histidine kinase n=1 Tax=Aequitasia blattaphilus TaxID=2949332 RepID=A0ABT1E862_9FIRM|nr:HAMP domain-containing sensor histidine kinase [Aequitasia blattaphilus]MCP1102020.1 HAMP domain-containing histidine kinase [Aequitasia blattaphilus]MCR8614660.1 HAMP domain-containing histidine kinase [Aequitasia blattaphilus]